MSEPLPLFIILVFLIIRIEWLGNLHFQQYKNVIDILDSLEQRIIKLEKEKQNE